MKKRMSGQVTILASLVIVIVISLICTCIQSAAMSVASTNVNIACNLSVESVFAGYSRPLLDEFDVMYLKQSHELSSRLKKYITENTSYTGSFNSIKLQSTQIEEKVMATDNGAESIKTEVIDYMKYGIMSELAKEILDSEKEIKKAKKTQELVKEIVECEQYTTVIDELMLQFISVVEGLDTSSLGFEVRGDKPVATNGNYAKQIVFGSVTATKVAVNNQKVYSAMKEEYVDVSELLEDIQINAESILEDGEDVSNQSAINSYKAIYQRNYDRLLDTVSGAKEQTQKAIEIAKQYDSNVKTVTTHVQKCKQDVGVSKNIIGEDLVSGFYESLDQISDFDENKEGMLCRISVVVDGLQNNLIVLEKCSSRLDHMDRELTEDNATDLKELALECESILCGYDVSQLIFDYSKVKFDSSATGIKGVKKVTQFIKNGVLGLVITDSNKISDKQIGYTDLASSLKSGNSNYWKNITEDSVDNALYNEYIFMKFNSFIDDIDNENPLNDNTLLKYSLEYVISGKDSDKQNLEETVIKLIAIREGANLAYLFTDQEKKDQSYALALILLGFTGIPAVVRAGQLLIMATWAYGEAIMDVRKLCDGQNVELAKNKDNWQLSLSNLMSKKFVDTETKKSSDKSNKGKGIPYEGYLRMLLFVENPLDKYYRTLDAMELRMMELGYGDFRMKNYIYSMSATAVFRINNSAHFYSQDMEYQY